jgi:hypothetical protein
VDLILTIPASSADAERGFNRLKIAKSDWRSKLSDTNLSDQMTIMLEGPSIVMFDPAPAINLWSMTPRREQVQKDVIKPLNNPVVNPTNETNNVNDVVIDENSAIESENETEEEIEIANTARRVVKCLTMNLTRATMNILMNLIMIRNIKILIIEGMISPRLFLT